MRRHNRNTVDRNAQVLLDGSPATPAAVLRLDDPALPIFEEPGTGSEIVVPAESLVLLEFTPERAKHRLGPATGSEFSLCVHHGPVILRRAIAAQIFLQGVACL